MRSKKFEDQMNKVEHACIKLALLICEDQDSDYTKVKRVQRAYNRLERVVKAMQQANVLATEVEDA